MSAGQRLIAALGADLTSVTCSGQWLTMGVGVDAVHGLALSPAIGELIAGQIVDGEPVLPLDALGYERFAGQTVAEVPTGRAG